MRGSSSWKNKYVRWGLIAGVLLVIIAVAIGGNHKSSNHAAALPAITTTSSPLSTTTRTPIATTRRTAKPVRKAKPPLVSLAGLAYSTASNDLVQSQPASGSCHPGGSGLFSMPDPKCTPGALNPAVTQSTIDKTICMSGWTSTVRPSESVTEQEKVASMAAYADSGSIHGYEYDHLVSLELGGATNDPRNLWPEPGGSPNPKDAVENALHRQVCDRQISLARAQHIIATDWVGWDRRNGISTGTASSTTSGSPPPAPIPTTTSSTSSPPVVHPGAFCSTEGAHGVTSAGTPMTCKASATDSRDRWRRSA